MPAYSGSLRSLLPGNLGTVATETLTFSDVLSWGGLQTFTGGMTVSGTVTDSGTTTKTGTFDASGATSVTLPGTMRTGYINIPLGDWRLIASSDIPAIAVASGNGGNLASDTAPKLIRMNGATDKVNSIQWAASGVVPVTASVAIPPDVDLTASVTFKMLARMAGASDTPTVGVVFLEVGTGAYSAPTSIGGNTAAVTGTSSAVYSKAVTAVKAIGSWTLELTPAAHGTDILYVFATWIEYQRKNA